MTNMMRNFFSMYLFLFVTLYFFQPAHISATNIEWLLPEAVLIQFVSPDDEHCVLETCGELQIEIST
jgi:hypothetical protein